MISVLTNLQTFLGQNEIPKIKSKPKTFLGITKQPHYENVLSNIYAFYFDVNEEHGFKDLFISSLLKCISKSKLGKQKELLQGFCDFEIETEFSAIKGGRIDILLSNSEQAIVIENKVYHHIKDNDLDDYWNSVKLEQDDHENKIGIILSLHPIAESEYNKFKNANHYINITHIALLKKVFSILGTHLLHANDKYLVYLKDLYQNIINLSHPLMNKENIAFYFKNKNEINEVVVFKNQYKDHIVGEIKKVGQTLDGVHVIEPKANTIHNGRLVYYKSQENSNLMLMVLYEKLLTIEPSLIIVVKMEGSLLKHREVYKKEIDFSEAEKAIFADLFEDEKNMNSTWSHFVREDYPLNENDVANLSEFIQQKLEDDHFLSVFRKIENFLISQKIKI